MSENLTKREIILAICEKTGLPQKEVRKTLQMSLDIIATSLLKGRNVELRNFGVFEPQVRKQRVGRNPNKPEKDVVIPERIVVKFKVGKELKEGLKTADIHHLGTSL